MTHSSGECKVFCAETDRPKVVSEAMPNDAIPYKAAENKNNSYDYI